METGSNGLMELSIEGAGILDTVKLAKSHLNPQVSECHESVEILMGVPEAQHVNMPCIEPAGMDFEFPNSDLVHAGEFCMDNTTMFGISENESEEDRNDCDELFRDSNCFNVNINKSNDNLIPVTLSDKDVATSYKDIGLRLQIIPLDNLQYVSTIQTDKGLHILAVPADTTVKQVQQHCIDGIPTNIKTLQPCTSLQCSPYMATSETFQYVPNQCTDAVTPVTAVCDTLASNANVQMQTGTEFMLDQSLQLEQEHCQSKLSTATLCDVNSFTSKRPLVSLLNNKTTTKNNLERRDSDKKGIGSRSIKLTIPLQPYANVTSTDASMSDIIKPQCTGPAHKCETTQDSERETTLASYVSSSDEHQTSMYSDGNSFCEQDIRSDFIHNKNTDLNIKHSMSESCPLRKMKPKDNRNKQRKHACCTVNTSTSDNEHVITTENDTGNARKNKIFLCTECPARFVKGGHLRNHLTVHRNMMNLNKQATGNCSTVDPHQPNVTDTATESVNDEEQVNDSVGTTIDDTIYADQTVPTCHKCALTFKSIGNLTRHQLTHTKQLAVNVRYSCADCGKGFLQKCDLTRHEQMHSGNFSFHCLICNKGFIRKSDMTVHKKFHLGEKSHQCKICPKSYVQQGDLSRHIRKSHADLCEFSCELCSVKYTTLKSRNQHMKTKHASV